VAAGTAPGEAAVVVVAEPAVDAALVFAAAGSAAAFIVDFAAAAAADVVVAVVAAAAAAAAAGAGVNATAVGLFVGRGTTMLHQKVARIPQKGQGGGGGGVALKIILPGVVVVIVVVVVPTRLPRGPTTTPLGAIGTGGAAAAARALLSCSSPHMVNKSNGRTTKCFLLPHILVW
jgi:hypothetical protein